MPITAVTKDLDALTLTVVAEFPVGVRRLWDAYTDPRQIEKFWGPPGFPATFTRHDAHAGGRSDYAMTGPDGERFGGYWEWVAVDAPHSFEVVDGFARPDGTPNADLPTTGARFVFESTETGARVTCVSTFGSLAELEQLSAMGMEEGMRAAMGQIDAVVADLASFAAGVGTSSQLLGDTQVRVSRIIRGSVEDVWRAHHDPALVQRWLLGPDGWTMPVCEIAQNIGDAFRQEWESTETGERFGFTGTMLAQDVPRREVSTEQMIGTDGPATTNELTLTPVEGGTLLTLVITYPDAGVREMVLGTGMVGGMEASYARLESELAA